jgi:2-keto-4-pentenoate hydratase
MEVGIGEVASALVKAQTTLEPVPWVEGMTYEEASAVKHEMLQQLSSAGERQVIGYKVSMSYTWGALFSGDALPSGETVERAALFDPLIETEAVFYLDEDIGPAMTVSDVLARCRVGAGIEIADCRWKGWCPSTPARQMSVVPEMLEADNAFARLVVLDDHTVPGPSLVWPDVMIRAERNGQVIAGGTLDHAMGHPANVLLWAAHKLAKVGETLKGGQFVFTGNPYRQLVTLPRGETGQFAAVLEGVGTATASFI